MRLRGHWHDNALTWLLSPQKHAFTTLYPYANLYGYVEFITVCVDFDFDFGLLLRLREGTTFACLLGHRMVQAPTSKAYTTVHHAPKVCELFVHMCPAQSCIGYSSCILEALRVQRRVCASRFQPMDSCSASCMGQ